MTTPWAGLAALALPLLFWLCRWNHWPFWAAGIVLLPLLAVRRNAMRGAAWIGGIAAALGALALLMRADLPLKLYPVAVNAAMLALFAWSLWHPPTTIERFARLRDPQLPAAAVPYLRGVTRAWCVFFMVNGAIAAVTALWADERVWSLYNGLIAYLLIGLMFAGERIARRWHAGAGHGA
jgi:uncharacterized membrane protein